MWGGGGGREEREKGKGGRETNTIVFSDNGATQRTGAGCAEDARLCVLDILRLFLNVWNKPMPSIGMQAC